LELLQAVGKFWKSGTTKDHYSIESNTAFHEAGLLKLNCDKALAFLQWKPVLDFQTTAEFTGEWYNYYYNNRSVSNVTDYTLRQIEAYAAGAKTKSISWAV
jgi:CDP-glucose 4,6-dehydratase